MDQSKISNHFSWTEALNLPSWGRLANETDGLTPEIKTNLVVLFSKMDKIRDHFSKEVIIHVAYRPILYNQQIKGAPNSSHTHGQAADFHVSGINCDDVRKDILDNKLLDSLSMRMEDLPGSGWVHLDIASVINNRFFKP